MEHLIFMVEVLFLILVIDYYRLASSPFDYGNDKFYEGTILVTLFGQSDFDTARHVISAWEDGAKCKHFIWELVETMDLFFWCKDWWWQRK